MKGSASTHTFTAQGRDNYDKIKWDSDSEQHRTDPHQGGKVWRRTSGLSPDAVGLPQDSEEDCKKVYNYKKTLQL